MTPNLRESIIFGAGVSDFKIISLKNFVCIVYFLHFVDDQDLDPEERQDVKILNPTDKKQL